MWGLSVFVVTEEAPSYHSLIMFSGWNHFHSSANTHRLSSCPFKKKQVDFILCHESFCQIMSKLLWFTKSWKNNKFNIHCWNIWWSLENFFKDQINDENNNKKKNLRELDVLFWMIFANFFFCKFFLTYHSLLRKVSKINVETVIRFGLIKCDVKRCIQQMATQSFI